ncbi:MAG: hypothetical protein ABEJ81_03180 [Haloferacaceae archaeon]
MSEATTPFAAMMELQRRSIDESRRALHRSVEIGKRANRIALGGIESGKSVQHGSNDVARVLVEAYADAVAETMPGDEKAQRNLKAVIDDQFDALDEMNAETWDAFHEAMEENAKVSEEFADRWLETVDDSYDDLLDVLARYQERSAESASG